MLSRSFPIRTLLLASALALVSSCGNEGRLPPPATLTPPADLLSRADKPAIPAAAATSEQAFETWRDDVDDWGTANAAIIDRACWWFQDAGVKLFCRTRPAQ